MKITEQELLGAIARGWCSPENERKAMDPALAFAIAEEVKKSLGMSSLTFRDMPNALSVSKGTKIATIDLGPNAQADILVHESHLGLVDAVIKVIPFVSEELVLNRRLPRGKIDPRENFSNGGYR